MDRTILHSDMNSFYASVECLYNPAIREKPVAVVGDIEQRHGIVLTKNQHAKKYGIQTGEAIWQAKQKCPSLVTVPAHYDLYIKFSKAARKIYARYSDQIESFGLDENWIDVSGSIGLFGSGESIAHEIRKTIYSELGVTVSVGVSWNKIFAKLGSDMKKPDAVTVIRKDNFKEKVWPLPASDLLYVGHATSKKLTKYGIYTVGQLAGMDPEFLYKLLGKWGGYLWSFANGHDISPVASIDYESSIKSVGNSMTTYRDVVNHEEAWQVITSLSESIARRLKENGFRCKTVQTSIKYTDFSWFERQIKLDTPSCIVSDLSKAAMQLFRNNVNFSTPIRALGVRACDLLSIDGGYQLDFMGDVARQERWEKIEGCVDTLRSRFGKSAVKRAVLLGADIIGESDPLTHDVHPVSYFR